nr:HEPN domain-containing protein [Desulfobulbaceae bacterium]
MSGSGKNDLMRYRLDRAHETLAEAIILKRENHWNACVNRLYYACFYAISALLLTKGLSSRKNSGVKALLNQHWVKPGKISKDKGRFYHKLFESRQEGDYLDFVEYDKETVYSWIGQAKETINHGYVDLYSRIS